MLNFIKNLFAKKVPAYVPMTDAEIESMFAHLKDEYETETKHVNYGGFSNTHSNY